MNEIILEKLGIKDILSYLGHFSPSSISQYIDCPRAFYYKSILKLQYPIPEVHLLFGSAIHSAIENHTEAYSIFDEEFSKNKLSENEYEKFNELYPIGKKMIDIYLEQKDFYDSLYEIKKGQNELWVNEILENPLTGEKLPIPMKGRIDKLSDNGIIIDYKTSSTKYNENDEGFKLQTRLYDLAYFSKNKVQANKILYFIFRKNLKVLNSNKPIQIIEFHNTLEDLAETFEIIKIKLQELKNKQFQYNPNHQYFCDCKKLDKFLLLD